MVQTSSSRRSRSSCRNSRCTCRSKCRSGTRTCGAASCVEVRWRLSKKPAVSTKSITEVSVGRNSGWGLWQMLLAKTKRFPASSRWRKEGHLLNFLKNNQEGMIGLNKTKEWLVVFSFSLLTLHSKLVCHGYLQTAAKKLKINSIMCQNL